MSELKVYHCNEWHNEYTEFYIKSEADKVIADLEESHKKEVGQLLIKIAELKEERRWRKFPDEKPEKGQKVLFRAKYKTENIRTWIGEFRNVGFDVFYASAPGWGCEFLPNEIFGWMPLPSTPKEER